jgi:lanosterol synthase
MVARQEQDGGWSEDFKSCELFTYVRHVKSEVVQTSWVLIMLLLGQYPDQAVIAKGISFLMSKQNSDGSYDWNHVEGVFNHSCSIEYPNYKFYFPMKAFGLYSNKYGRDATV